MNECCVMTLCLHYCGFIQSPASQLPVVHSGKNGQELSNLRVKVIPGVKSSGRQPQVKPLRTSAGSAAECKEVEKLHTRTVLLLYFFNAN